MDFTHPVFRIKAGTKLAEVKALLGDPSITMSVDQVVPYLDEQGAQVVREHEDQPEVSWLYERDAEDLTTVVEFSFGSVVRVEVSKDEAGKKGRIVQINVQGIVVNREHFGLTDAGGRVIVHIDDQGDQRQS